ncbi:hypothetical protein O0L34_g1787 [Tuta absoluta]|nr:hypothetical protein O0L34_g1787 [Tuta absoluta]
MATKNGHVPGKDDVESVTNNNDDEIVYKNENIDSKETEMSDGKVAPENIVISIDTTDSNTNNKKVDFDEIDLKVQQTENSELSEKQNGVIAMKDKEKHIVSLTADSNDLQNGGARTADPKDLLGVPRNGPRMSFMEEESLKERMRLSLLKQCSAILKQGDQRYNKESLHKTFQDEVRACFLLA